MSNLIQIPKNTRPRVIQEQECVILELKPNLLTLNKKLNELNKFLIVVSSIYGKDSEHADFVWGQIDEIEDQIYLLNKSA